VCQETNLLPILEELSWDVNAAAAEAVARWTRTTAGVSLASARAEKDTDTDPGSSARGDYTNTSGGSPNSSNRQKAEGLIDAMEKVEELKEYDLSLMSTELWDDVIAANALALPLCHTELAKAVTKTRDGKLEEFKDGKQLDSARIDAVNVLNWFCWRDEVPNADFNSLRLDAKQLEQAVHEAQVELDRITNEKYSKLYMLLRANAYNLRYAAASLVISLLSGSLTAATNNSVNALINSVTARVSGSAAGVVSGGDNLLFAAKGMFAMKVLSACVNKFKDKVDKLGVNDLVDKLKHDIYVRLVSADMSEIELLEKASRSSRGYMGHAHTMLFGIDKNATCMFSMPIALVTQISEVISSGLILYNKSPALLLFMFMVRPVQNFVIGRLLEIENIALRFISGRTPNAPPDYKFFCTCLLLLTALVLIVSYC